MNQKMIAISPPMTPGDTAPRRFRRRCGQLTALVVFAAFAVTTAATATAQTGRSAEADGMLKKMSDYMAGLKSFTVNTTNTTEMVDGNGQKLDFSVDGVVSIQHPDKMAAHRVDPNKEAFAYYDGANFTVFTKQLNLYATTPAPASLHEALDFIIHAVQVDLPGADLLYRDIYEGMTWDATSSSYLGKESIGGKIVNHLAYRTTDVDFQIWIQDGNQPVPLRYVITSKMLAGAPQYGVELSNWVINPKLDAKIFEFKAPAGATRIDFLTSQGATP